jgi:hypothetical protein
MEHRTDVSDSTLARLASVRDEQLTSLAAGRAAEALYQEVVNMPEEDTLSAAREVEASGGTAAPRARRRLLPRLALVAGAVAAVVVAVSVSGVLGDRGPATVAPAQAIEKATDALTADKDTIYHFVVTGSQTSGGHTATWSREEWSSFAGQGERTIQKDDEIPWLEMAVTPDGRLQLYDPKTQTVYEKTMPAGDRLPDGTADDTYRPEILSMLKSGQAAVTGPVTIDGRRAVRIVSADKSLTYYVDATTYDPIRLDWDLDGMNTFRFSRYDRIKETAESLKLLDLREAYPDATVVTGAAQYEQALAHLTGRTTPGQTSPQPTESASPVSTP